MTDTQITTLIGEFRVDYQIPSYITDEALTRIARESEAFIGNFNYETDFETDLTARELLKARMFYKYNHCENEFQVDYNSDILSWQMATLDSEDSEDE